MDLTMQPDVSERKQLLMVRAIADNREGRLIPKAKVYAEIESEPISVCQKVRRELMKLFNFRKYGIGS